MCSKVFTVGGGATQSDYSKSMFPDFQKCWPQCLVYIRTISKMLNAMPLKYADCFTHTLGAEISNVVICKNRRVQPFQCRNKFGARLQICPLKKTSRFECRQ